MLPHHLLQLLRFLLLYLLRLFFFFSHPLYLPRNFLGELRLLDLIGPSIGIQLIGHLKLSLFEISYHFPDLFLLFNEFEL